MTLSPRLSYFDFPFCRETFCTGRGPTSSAVIIDGVTLRRYGRNVFEHTLVTWDDLAQVGTVMRALRDGGSKLKSMNFIHPPVDGTPIVKRSPEFFVPGHFDTEYSDRSAKTRQTMRRACRDLTWRPAMDRHYSVSDEPAVWAIFHGWVSWASTRHFMVFKGHYLRWIQLWFERPRPNTFLYMIFHDHQLPVGIFGGEIDPETREAQVTVAKHLPSLSAKALWTLGLRAIIKEHQPTLIHCGSTADTLKLSLGFEPLPSYVVDVKALGDGMPIC